MKFRFIGSASLALALPFFCPLEAHAKTVKLFIIGNSFSQNAARYLPKLAAEGGHMLQTGRAEAPGHSLGQHWKAAEANLADPVNGGKIYGGKSLREIIGKGDWDYVTLQQASFHSANPDTYRPYGAKLRSYVHSLAPNAKFLLHQTWAYRVDAKTFAALSGGGTAKNNQEMYENSRNAYRSFSEELGLPIIPTGEAFWKVATDPVWGYKPDTAFDFGGAKEPALPDQKNSLHAGYAWRSGKLTMDANHANDAGCYLGSLLWYGVLFEESPEKVTYVPAGVDPQFAAYLRQVAASTLADIKDWNAAIAAQPAAPFAEIPAQIAAPVPAPVPATVAAPGTEPAPGAAPGAAPPVNARPTVDGMAAQADTSVRGGEMSGRNFGSLDILRVRTTQNAIGARKTYLRFDLSKAQPPAARARAAALNLTLAPAEGSSPADKTWTFQVYGLKDGGAGEAWEERSTNWNNAPALEGPTGNLLTDQTQLLGTFTLTGKGTPGQTVNFAAPALLQFLQADTNSRATLIISRVEAGDTTADSVVHIFASREHKTLAGPSLTLSGN